MNNRAFSKIWIIVIFVVFLVGGILAWQYWMPKEEVRISEEVTKKDETTNWETYKNQDLGFEIKYPRDWVVEFPDKLHVIFYPLSFKEEFEHPFIGITKKPNPQKLSIREFYNGVHERDLFFQSGDEYTTGKIMGKDYFKFSPYITFTGETIVVIPLDSAFIEISDFGDAFQENGIFDQMLSTLRFIETDEIADWKKCQNIKYGYEIKYPLDWKVWKPGAPETRLATCDENLAIIAFSPNIYVPNESSLLIDVYDKERLKGTIYEGSKSLEDYFSKNPEILENNPIIKESIINGERAVWLQSFPSPRIFIFHNDSIFELNGRNLNSSFFNKILPTFRFIETDETANWKTYINEEYGFEIKYPEDWSLSGFGFYTYFTPKKSGLEKVGARFDILRREVRPEDEIRCKNNETFLGTAEIQDLITNKCAFQDFGDVAQNDWRISIIRDSTYLSFICKKYQMVEEKCEQILSTFRFLE